MTFLDKLLGKDALAEIRDVIINLELLAEAEAQIAAFYRLCAGRMPQDGILWNSLADAEVQHSENIHKMISMIHKDRARYAPGISFSTVAIRLFAVEMENLADRMQKGRIPAAQLFPIALDIENSVIEARYSTIVKTSDAAFNALACSIDRESAEHSATLAARIPTTPHD